MWLNTANQVKEKGIAKPSQGLVKLASQVKKVG